MRRYIGPLVTLLGVAVAGCEQVQGHPGLGTPGATQGGGGGGAVAGAGVTVVAGNGGTGGGQMDPLAQAEPDPNQVPFECNSSAPAAGPRRIARLNAAQYTASLAAVFEAVGVGMPNGIAPPFDYVNPADRFSTYARSYGMNDAELQSAWETASYAADAMASELVAQLDCLADATSQPACIAGLVRKAAQAAFRRSVSETEAGALAGRALERVAEIGVQEALATVLHSLLLAPEFLFRSELGDGSAGPNDPVPLTPSEQAAAVAYAIQDRPPDAALVGAASRGPEALAAEVTKQLSELAKVPTVGLMLRQYFRYPGAVNVFKDPKVLPDAHRVDLVKDTDTLVAKVLEARGHERLFESLMTWPDVWVSQDTVSWYGITEETKTHEKQLRNPPPGTRLGILSQPSFLVYYSDMSETKPVQRGRFILESVLCATVPELPIGMVPKLPDLGENATQRARLAAHTVPATCRGCHALMDPLGLAFEQFDEYGRFRTEQAGAPIDASGMLSGSIDRDGPFVGALDLIQKLSESEGALQCFVRHSFRYWMGRSERAADGCALVQARDAYRSSNGDYAALVAALFASRSFRERAQTEVLP